MEEHYVTYTNALITITVFLIGHLMAGIWWASKVNTILTGLTNAVDKLTGSLVKHEERHYSKFEAAKDFTERDKRIDAAWNKIDRLESVVQDNMIKIEQIKKG